MFSWRTRRQFIALAIVGLPIIFILVFFVFKIFPEASCFDNRQNQRELGVDCGGPCEPCELKNPKPLTLFWARLVPVRENSYDLVALIQNPNEVLSSRKVDYEFTIYDGLRPVTRKIGSTFIFAQERMHIIEPNVQAVEIPSHVEFKVTGINWEFSQLQKPNFVVEKRDYLIEEQDGIKRSVASSRILNATTFNFKEVLVEVVVFDKDGNVLGSNRTVISNFLAGTRSEIKLPWPEVLKGEVRTLAVEARVNIFDTNAILTPQ